MTAGHFFSIAARTPGAPALVDPDERVHTYGELAAEANRLARGLRAAGLHAGDTVAALLPNGTELLTLYAAAVQSGLVLVVPNWHLTAGEVSYLLADAGCGLLVSHERFADAAREAAEQASLPDDVRFSIGAIDGFRPLVELTAGHGDDPLPQRAAGQIMFFTSGTTGRPKGVRKRIGEVPPDEVGLMTGIGIRRVAQPITQAVTQTATQTGPQTQAPSDVVHLVGGPLYHAMPIAMAATALDTGALLVLMERWTPERWLELVERYRVTHASLVPTMFHRLLALPDEVRLAADVSSLRAISHSGAPCSVDVKRRMIDWLGPIITESYSSTEGAGTSVTSQEWLERPGTVGRPSPGVTLRILDEEGRDCPPGVPGLVYLSQTLWEFDYHQDPQKTNQSRHEGLFTVGDIGYVDDDGYLFLCDRQAEVIISGGVNIYPAEVEARLLAHPLVGDVAVIGIPDDEWGEAVHAIVEPARKKAVVGDEVAAELIRWARDGLAHFKCPRSVEFVENLGRDPNGKIRKGELRKPYWAGRDRRI